MNYELIEKLTYISDALKERKLPPYPQFNYKNSDFLNVSVKECLQYIGREDLLYLDEMIVTNKDRKHPLDNVDINNYFSENRFRIRSKVSIAYENYCEDTGTLRLEYFIEPCIFEESNSELRQINKYLNVFPDLEFDCCVDKQELKFGSTMKLADKKKRKQFVSDAKANFKYNLKVFIDEYKYDIKQLNDKLYPKGYILSEYEEKKLHFLNEKIAKDEEIKRILKEKSRLINKISNSYFDHSIELRNLIYDLRNAFVTLKKEKRIEYENLYGSYEEQFKSWQKNHDIWVDKETLRREKEYLLKKPFFYDEYPESQYDVIDKVISVLSNGYAETLVDALNIVRRYY